MIEFSLWSWGELLIWAFFGVSCYLYLYTKRKFKATYFCANAVHVTVDDAGLRHREVVNHFAATPNYQAAKDRYFATRIRVLLSLFLVLTHLLSFILPPII